MERTASSWRATRFAGPGRRIALAGGVASNIKANRRIRLLPGVEEVYVFPHMGDGGLAVGAAARPRLGRERPTSISTRLDLGPEYTDAAIERRCERPVLPYPWPHLPGASPTCSLAATS